MKRIHCMWMFEVNKEKQTHRRDKAKTNSHLEPELLFETSAALFRCSHRIHLTSSANSKL